MSIGATLNIAKEALLTHQSAISVAGHNVANVNTPGYSRQVLDLTTAMSSQSGVGFFGNGVRAEAINRQYDKFMLQRLLNQNSNINNLTSQQQSMRVIETTFNEVPGLAVNELLSKFWESWQALSNNPELSSNRQTVVQQAEILNEQLHNMSADLAQAKFDTGVSLTATIKDVNAITVQIADINAKIAASESTDQQQNDLRDTRDNLMKELGGYVDITYYEASNGSYTVMMADGHSLVNNNEAWRLDWQEGNLQWVNINGKGQEVRTNLDSSTFLGGTIGGLLQTYSQLIEGNPDNYLGRLDALSNALIREVNQQHSQGVGLVSFSDELTSAEVANDAILLHTTVDVRSAAETLSAGDLKINNRSIGRIDGSVSTYGLAMGKTANAAQAINDASAGVLARMTTQVSGNAVSAMNVDASEDTVVLDFSINGLVDVSYAVDSAVATQPANDTDPALLASHLVDAINTAIDAHNIFASPENVPKVTIQAVLGNGGNGGAVNSIILRNTNAGDESSIVLSGIDTVTEAKLGLANGSNKADATHNTGELSLFSHDGPVSIDGGADDVILAQLGWAGTTTYSDLAAVDTPALTGSTSSFTLNGKDITVTIAAGRAAALVAEDAVTEINRWSVTTGVVAEVGDGTNGGPLNSIVFSSTTKNITVSNFTVLAGADVLGFSNFVKKGVAAADETANDGKLTYSISDNGVSRSLFGLDYADTLKTDGGSFELWLYNSNGTLALAQPVAIDLTRTYTLDDVANTINVSIMNAIDDPAVTAPWVSASVVANQLVLKPDASHTFAFSNDTSNFLSAMGVNTFFSGHSASTIAINQTVATNVNNLAAGKINQFGEIFAGDNANALLTTNIQRDENITYIGRGSSTDTLDGFYNSLIAEIGLNGKGIDTDLEYNQLVLDQLNEIRDATSGVSLDEEMANLIKFQHAYSAAAKLISTSDEMLKTLLDSVR